MISLSSLVYYLFQFISICFCFDLSGDAVGPLEMLYEFGELECISGTVSVQTTHRPVLLFGTQTSSIGAQGGIYPKKWQETTAGENLHTVIEGCEPSTGIR